MVAGDVKTIADAACKVGLSREHLSRDLSRPDVTELMHQKVRRSLATAAARASHIKVGQGALPGVANVATRGTWGMIKGNAW
jgi:hypothetical protein